ncbi:hypothetical protein DENSPDRAFT_878089 [Dentipellis sp. KUC8613]|nr:hypothetical protein DENSPDRAFT_878089 [Dentipellis sp. KUC8613]
MRGPSTISQGESDDTSPRRVPRLSSSHSSSSYMLSSSPSSADIQAHLYSSFLERKTADVALRVRGTWEAVYKLHRVVLIQAGFFRSLFTGGFVESADRTSSSRRHPHLIEIVFDDTNITRAAFELCIARLYGGGPATHILPSTLPTSTQPLTSQFSMPALRDETPAGQQPVTPRFLLSLLATAIYLSIPSLASQALSSIVRSVGPYSVIPYLDFAIGKGIGPLREEDLEAAVGLEHVAEPIEPSVSHTGFHTPSPAGPSGSQAKDTSSLTQALESLSVSNDPAAERDRSPHDNDYFVVKKEDPAEISSSEDGCSSDHHHAPEMHFHYGAVSDKIGEVATCWLARWGIDMLAYEQVVAKGSKRPAESSAFAGHSHARRSTLPSSWDHAPIAALGPMPSVIPVIWRRGGLSAKWVRALMSSDSLFVRGERERYDMAKAIVELRRSEGVLEEEEIVWKTMFTEGIYYQNMTLEDLVYISQDISPTTGQLYTPLHVIQSAHWSYSLLQHQLTGRPSTTSPPSSPSTKDKELGLAVSSAELSNLISSPSGESEKSKPYWPVPSDSSSRIGDSTGIEGASMDELFELPSAIGSKRAMRTSHSEETFFGLKTDRRLASACAASDAATKTRWLPHPPFRFAVEFWDVEALREKSRLHSHTIWYAGSLFNVYVQLVRKKGIQLGVYLHRQSSIDPIPPPSMPFMYRADRMEKEREEARHARSPSSPSSARPSSSPSNQYSSSGLPIVQRSTTPTSSHSVGHSPSQGQTLPATGTPIMPAQPYRDPRPAVSAYFTISCASATGNSLTKFTSAPDVFSVSQSWGWKSSSLRTEEYLEVGGKDGLPVSPIPAEKEVSLRVTVVLGLI